MPTLQTQEIQTHNQTMNTPTKFEIWYRTTSYSTETEEAKVTRQSEKCVWAIGWGGNESRHNKDSAFERYWQNKREAIEFLIEREQAKLESAKRAAEKSEYAIKRLKSQLEK